MTIFLGRKLFVPGDSKWILLLTVALLGTKSPCHATLCDFYNGFRTPDQHQDGTLQFLHSIIHTGGRVSATNSYTLPACMVKAGFPCAGFDVAKTAVERLGELDAFLKHVETQAYGSPRVEQRSPFTDKVKQLLETSRDLAKWSCLSSGQCGTDSKCAPGKQTKAPWNYMDSVKEVYTKEALEELKLKEEEMQAMMSTQSPQNPTSESQENSAARQDSCYIFMLAVVTGMGLIVLGINL